MLVWRKGNINKNCLCVTILCTIIMVHKDTNSSYRSVDYIGLGLALCLPSASVSSVLMVLKDTKKNFAYILLFTF